jgi:Protein of unknown function (DUF4233)
VNLITLSARNPMRTVLLSILIFEVILFGLAVPVMIFNSNVSVGMAAGVSGAAALLALVAAGMLRRPAGYPLGWLTQLVALALGVLTPSMFVVGGLFAGLWVLTFVLGKRLDAAKDTGGS